MTLRSYLFRKISLIFIGSLFFFAFLLQIVDLLMNMWQYISEEVPFLTIGKLWLLYLPKAVSFSIPLSILFAVSYTLSDLYAHNELTVIFASGISLLKFVMPLLLFSFILSLAFFYFEDTVVVPSYGEKVSLQKKVLNQTTSYNNDNLVILSDSGKIVYKADYYDDIQKRLFNLFVFIRNEDMTLNKVIKSDSAMWNESLQQWVFSKPVTYTNIDETLVMNTGTDYICRELPDTFKNIRISVEEVNVTEAKKYIEKLRRTGMPTAEAENQYYKKFAFPFVLFIVVFLSAGLSGKSRKNVLLMSLVSCVCVAVLFYVTQMITMLLARFGYISPLWGAWFPVFLFIVLSIIILRYART